MTEKESLAGEEMQQRTGKREMRTGVRMITQAVVRQVS